MRLYCTYCGDPIPALQIECATAIGEEPPALHGDCIKPYEELISRLQKQEKEQKETPERAGP